MKTSLEPRRGFIYRRRPWVGRYATLRENLEFLVRLVLSPKRYRRRHQTRTAPWQRQARRRHAGLVKCDADFRSIAANIGMARLRRGPYLGDASEDRCSVGPESSPAAEMGDL